MKKTRQPKNFPDPTGHDQRDHFLGRRGEKLKKEKGPKKEEFAGKKV